MKRYEHLDKAMCRELEKLDKKYAADVEMTPQDLDRADSLYHAMKSAETYYAMVDAEGDEDDGDGRSYRGGRGYSYARTRSPRTGRYLSREDGWSGRYPMEYIDPYWDRR